MLIIYWSSTWASLNVHSLQGTTECGPKWMRCIKHYTRQRYRLTHSTLPPLVSTSSIRNEGETSHPLYLSLYGNKPKNLVQFDHLEPGVGRSCENYVMLARDFHSTYCWLHPASRNDEAIAANTLLDLGSALGASSGLISDGPTHFK